MFVALLAVQSFDLGRPVYEKQELFTYISVALSFIVVLITGFMTFKSTQADRLVGGIALCILPFLLLLHLAVPEQFLKRKSPQLVLQQYRSQTPNDAIVIADSYNVGAVAWALKRQDIYLVSPGELRYGAGYPDASGRLLNPAFFQALLQQNLKTHSVVMICSEDCDNWMLQKLPSNTVQYNYGIFELRIIPRQDDDA